MITTETKNKRKEQIRIMQKNLRGLRILAGYTVAEFAEEVGVTAQAVRNWENQKTDIQFPTYIALRRMFEIVASNDNNALLMLAMDRIFNSEYNEMLATNILTIAILERENTNGDLAKEFAKQILGELPTKVEWQDIPSWVEELCSI